MKQLAFNTGIISVHVLCAQNPNTMLIRANDFGIIMDLLLTFGTYDKNAKVSLMKIRDNYNYRHCTY